MHSIAILVFQSNTDLDLLPSLLLCFVFDYRHVPISVLSIFREHEVASTEDAHLALAFVKNYVVHH